MTAVRCIRAEFLIERRAAGLSAAEALRLEAHLASCEHCNEQARMLSGLRALAQREALPLTPVARERALQRALAIAPAAGEGAQPGRAFPQRSLSFAFGFACATALAVAVVAIGLRGMPRGPEAARGDRVLAGAVEREGRTLGQGALPPGTTELAAPHGALLALAHAKVELTAGTSIRWRAQDRVLALDSGRLSADVDPSAKRSFTVQTPRFTVLVLGTHFEVSLDAVSVQRGRVRVVDRDGRVLAAGLGAGERFDLASTPASAAQPTLPTKPESAKPIGMRSAKPGAVRPAIAARAPERSSAQTTSVARASQPSPTEAAPAQVDIGGLLARARAELAARHATEARQQIDAALARGPARSLRAEALSLRAECALVAGEPRAATDAYLSVAWSFADLPAGENALFAAARLEADRGERDSAVRELERYLAQYPRGRFIKEATARLQALGAAPKTP